MALEMLIAFVPIALRTPDIDGNNGGDTDAGVRDARVGVAAPGSGAGVDGPPGAAGRGSGVAGWAGVTSASPALAVRARQAVFAAKTPTHPSTNPTPRPNS
jgi:hypothetical protein